MRKINSSNKSIDASFCTGRQAASGTQCNSSTVPRVAVLVETSTSWGRRLIRGVGNFVRENRPWQLAVEPLGINQPVRFPVHWQGEGVIARVHTRALANQLASMDIPVVNVSGVDLSNANFAQVTTDERKICNLAANHLRDRGFEHFAYYSDLGKRFTRNRGQVFADIITQAGLKHYSLESYHRRSHHVWDADNKELVSWLKSLPKPVGILAWNSLAARRVAQACVHIGIAVPDEVAIISVDIDDLLGEVVSPALSGVRLAMERCGYEAAALLNQMMQGEIAHGSKDKRVLVDPQGITVRQSTDILAIDDQFLRDAIRFIRKSADKPIAVTDILKAVPISRRALELGIRKTLGRSPAAEIRRVHLERAKELLADTYLPIPKVAQASGFKYVEHMIGVFRKHTGYTPLVYRKYMSGVSSKS